MVQEDTRPAVEDPVRRQRYRFEQPRDGAQVLEVWVDPKGNVPLHLHPSQSERFEMLEGEVTFRAGSNTVVAGPGEVVEVPPQTKHRFVNKSGATAHMRVTVTPPGRIQATLEDAAALARAGRMNRLNLPTSPGAALDLALFAKRYSDETVVLNPPRVLQRLLMEPLARLAERRR